MTLRAMTEACNGVYYGNEANLEKEDPAARAAGFLHAVLSFCRQLLIPQNRGILNIQGDHQPTGVVVIDLQNRVLLPARAKQ